MFSEDITYIGIIAMVVGGAFAVIKMALELITITLRSKFGSGNNPHFLKESMETILPLITKEVPNRPGELMIWRETNGKLRQEINRLATAIDALTEIIKDVRGAARESANESREARMISEKVLTQLLAG